MFSTMRIKVVVYYFSGRVASYGSRLIVWTWGSTPSPVNVFKTHVFMKHILELFFSIYLVCLLDPKSPIIFNTSSWPAIKKQFRNRQSYVKIEASDTFILSFLPWICFPLWLSNSLIWFSGKFHTFDVFEESLLAVEALQSAVWILSRNTLTSLHMMYHMWLPSSQLVNFSTFRRVTFLFW